MIILLDVEHPNWAHGIPAKKGKIFRGFVATYFKPSGLQQSCLGVVEGMYYVECPSNSPATTSC